jgi:hypothetical protein
MTPVGQYYCAPACPGVRNFSPAFLFTVLSSLSSSALDFSRFRPAFRYPSVPALAKKGIAPCRASPLTLHPRSAIILKIRAAAV